MIREIACSSVSFMESHDVYAPEVSGGRGRQGSNFERLKEIGERCTHNCDILIYITRTYVTTNDLNQEKKEAALSFVQKWHNPKIMYSANKNKYIPQEIKHVS